MHILSHKRMKAEAKLDSLKMIWYQFVNKLYSNSEFQSNYTSCDQTLCKASSFRHALAWLMPLNFGHLTEKPKSKIAFDFQFSSSSAHHGFPFDKTRSVGERESTSASQLTCISRCEVSVSTFSTDLASRRIFRQRVWTWQWHPLLNQAVQCCPWFFLILV